MIQLWGKAFYKTLNDFIVDSGCTLIQPRKMGVHAIDALYDLGKAFKEDILRQINSIEFDMVTKGTIKADNIEEFFDYDIFVKNAVYIKLLS